VPEVKMVDIGQVPFLRVCGPKPVCSHLERSNLGFFFLMVSGQLAYVQTRLRLLVNSPTPPCELAYAEEFDHHHKRVGCSS